MPVAQAGATIKRGKVDLRVEAPSRASELGGAFETSLHIPFNGLPIALAVFDEDDILMAATDAFCGLVGGSNATLAGQAKDLLFGSQPGAADLSGVVKRGRQAELSLLYTELGPIPVAVTSCSIHYDGAKCSLLSVHDVRHDREIENLMRAVVAAAPTATLVSDRSGKIVFSNAAAEKMFGHGADALLRMNVDDLVPPAQRRHHARHRDMFARNSLSRPMGNGQSIVALHKDGTLFPVEIALYPVESSDNDLIHCTVTDLTERHAAEALSDQKSQRLEALNADLSAFAYSASHDLKAPLSSISGLLSICLEDLDDGNLSELRENLENAVEISRRSAHKVEGVLAIARVGQDSIPAERFDPLREIKDIWRDLTGAMVAPPEFRVDLDLPETIRTERPTFNLVLENLLSNALRYGDPKKDRHRIRVSGALRDDRVCLIVADNGLGIAPDSQHRIFKMFDRIDDRSGDGMGLSLVRKQVERLNGTISVNSTPGAGAEFSFSLPVLMKGET